MSDSLQLLLFLLVINALLAWYLTKHRATIRSDFGLLLNVIAGRGTFRDNRTLGTSFLELAKCLFWILALALELLFLSLLATAIYGTFVYGL